ncbi:MAG: alpha/beta hydrolase [Deltaproteobacteria bacterium]|nr:MAG: alpha/beta hydrolase [Deltaproteobacteria bacterium]
MTRAPPRERRVQTDPRGLRLCVREHGIASGVPLLILHGYLEQSAAWDPIAIGLAPRWVVAPDHRGHGLSDHAGVGGSYPFWDYVADVAALVEDLGGQVDLVGHSMGGTIAALYAACRPAQVRKLVLIEGLGPPDGEPRAVQQARQALRQRLDPPAHRPLADLEEAVVRMRRANPTLSEPTARALAARTTAPVPGGGLIWTFDPLHRARSHQAFSAHRFMAFLRAIEAPTLLVEGGASPMQGVPDLAERRANLLHADRIVLEGVGHHPHHECPQALIALLKEHLNA